MQGVMDGTIDCIATHHTAQNKDAKICEFEYAGYGTLGLEAAFGLLGTTGLSIDNILQCICFQPRSIFQLPATIEKNQSADLTIFDIESTGTYTNDHIRSKSANAAFIGQPFKGSAIATILHSNYQLK